MALVEHTAARKSWDCRICFDPWPCKEAQRQLADEMGATQLAMFAWVQLEHAVHDLPDMSVADAFDRFIGWTRPPRGVPEAGL